MLNSQIRTQNPRIRSNTTRIRKKNRKPGGEDRQGKPREATTPGERTAGYTAQQSYLIHVPTFLSLVRRNSYTIPSSLWRTRHVFFDPYSSTIAKLLTTVLLLLLLLDMFPVAAGIAERVGGAAALFKVIVSSFPDFLSVTLSSFLFSVILIQSLCIFLQVEPIFSNLWLC